jgi:Cu(I)/Ag(I) efflux system membrane fusion protein
MRRHNFALVALIILGAALIGASGYWLGTKRSSPAGAPVTPGRSSPETDIAAAAQGASNQAGDKIDPKTGRKVLYWHDPMIPGPKFDKPGKSPFMDMELVPVYAGEAGDEGKVSISPRTVQNLGIRTMQVSEGEMEMGVETVGAVAVDERTITAVQSRVNGYIEKLHVRAQYDPVRRGQPLVDIYAPDWLSAEQEYLTLKQATQPGAELLAEAARERLGLLGIPEKHIKQLDETGQTNARVTLFAPEAGVIWELGTRDGSAVSPGMTLFKLASLRSVWVNAEVPETQTALVMPGVKVTARAAAFPDKTFEGRVALILPDVNPVTRTIRARIEIGNAQGLLKPGMFTRLAFGGRQKRALMVPTEALIYTGKRTVVIVAEGDGKFRPVEVQTGLESGDMTEIRKGLEPAQKVVVSGQFLIDSEASLRGVLARLNDPNATQPAGSSAQPAASAKPQTHRGEGKVVAFEGNRVTLQHGPIPSIGWGPMTMPFVAPPKGLPRGLEVGDHVTFEFVMEKSGTAQLMFIAPTPAGAAQSAGEQK